MWVDSCARENFHTTATPVYESAIMTSAPFTIGFLGIGLMGGPQARNLLRAGYPLTAWNRSVAKAEALVPLGARVAKSPDEAVREADAIIVMLENGPIVEDVLFRQGVMEASKLGSIVIDMSSIKPAEAKDHARRLAERGVAHIDAPVSGGTVGAEQGTLAIMAGGEADAFLRVRTNPARDGPARACRTGWGRPVRQARQPDHRRRHHRRHCGGSAARPAGRR